MTYINNPMRKFFDHIFTDTIYSSSRSFSTGENIGRYYVFIKNMEGTKGDVYIEFHGDRLSASGEQHLFKCENYPDNAFANKHTVGHENINIFISVPCRIYST